MSSEDGRRSAQTGAVPAWRENNHQSLTNTVNQREASLDDHKHGLDSALGSSGSSSTSLKDEALRYAADDDPEIETAEGHHLIARTTTSDTALSFNEEDGRPPVKEESKAVTWRSLPRKDQLFVLTLSRLSEPLTQTSLQAYMFYMLKSFDENLPDATIASQAGLLQGAFTAAQFCTAIMWGRIADAEWGGRKKVIFIGLLGTMISVVGFGFSKNFTTAIIFRCLGGVLNGNVGVMRTMISEIIKEKKYQARAFLLLPMTFNIGVILGPILGGVLADPVGSYPGLFGPGSAIGGKNGVWWMTQWPYALPNLVSAVFLCCSMLAVTLLLEETHDVLKHKPDIGLKVGVWISRLLCRRRTSQQYQALAHNEDDDTNDSPTDIEMQPTPTTPTAQSTFPKAPTKPAVPKPILPMKRMFTRNVLNTFISHGILALHVGTFNNLWFIFLSTPRFDPAQPSPPSHKSQQLPFAFTGGLALPPPRIGMALAIMGVIGISLQLLLYPRVSARYGAAFTTKMSYLLFPFAYALAPFLAMLHSSTTAPKPASGVILWIGISSILFIQVMARTFALPGTTILVNNCCPHPSVLGTIHGMGQSVSSGTRTIGPILFSWLFGIGLTIGMVGLSWWCLAAVACVGAVAGTFVREGSGHEIIIEGDKEYYGVEGELAPTR